MNTKKPSINKKGAFYYVVGVATIFAAIYPLSQGLVQLEGFSLLGFLQKPVPLWVPLVITISSIALGGYLIRRNEHKDQPHKIEGPSLTSILKGSKEERDRYYGKWHGEGRDVNLPGERGAKNTYTNVELLLEEQQAGITGKFTLTVVNEKERREVRLHCNVELIAVCGDFILLRFAMKKIKANHFGVIFLRITEAGDILHGYFLKKRVYGPSRLGLGEFELSREDSLDSE